MGCFINVSSLSRRDAYYTINAIHKNKHNIKKLINAQKHFPERQCNVIAENAESNLVTNF